MERSDPILAEREFTAESLESRYDPIRSRPETFCACTLTDPAEIFDTYYSLIFELGRTSIPVAIAVAMHAYVLAAIATYPIPRFHPYALLRKRFLERIRSEAALIANTNVYRSADSFEYAHVADTGGGRFALSGFARHMSLATVARYALVRVLCSARRFPTVCLVALHRDGGYEPGRLVFTGSMHASDTRTVVFRSCRVDRSYVLVSTGEDQADTVARFQQAWFQALIPAAYLGGISTLLERMRPAPPARNGAGAEPNGNYPALCRAYGRARLNAAAAKTLCMAARDSLARFIRSPDDGIAPAYEAAALAKVVGVDLAEEATTLARRAARGAYMVDPLAQQIANEVLYARLHPASEELIEAHFFDAK